MLKGENMNANTYNYLANERAIKRKKKAERMLEQERAEHYKDMCKNMFCIGFISGMALMTILVGIITYVM